MPAEGAHAIFLGVDGGGTKTAFCLIDAEDRVLAEAITGTCAFLSVGFDAAERVLDDGLRTVCGKAGIARADIAYAFLALPAYGEVPEAVPRLHAMAARLLGHDRFACGNDMVAGWAGSFALADGINVIAGTGSMTYGERRGRGLRCGGWGEIVGDEGSGYWIGREALNLFTRMSDGRMAKSPLYERMRDRLRLSADLELVDVVHNRWQGGRTEIASLAVDVAQAAQVGDPAASQLFARAAEELAILVDATRRGLEFGKDEITPVSWSGGLFSTNSPLAELLIAALVRRSPTYRPQAPLHEPVFGAALFARRQTLHMPARRYMF